MQALNEFYLPFDININGGIERNPFNTPVDVDIKWKIKFDININGGIERNPFFIRQRNRRIFFPLHIPAAKGFVTDDFKTNLESIKTQYRRFNAADIWYD